MANSEIDFERVGVLLGIIKAVAEHGKWSAIAQAAFAELNAIDQEEKDRLNPATHVEPVVTDAPRTVVTKPTGKTNPSVPVSTPDIRRI